MIVINKDINGVFDLIDQPYFYILDKYEDYKIHIIMRRRYTNLYATYYESSNYDDGFARIYIYEPRHEIGARKRSQSLRKEYIATLGHELAHVNAKDKGHGKKWKQEYADNLNIMGYKPIGEITSEHGLIERLYK